MLFFGLSTMRAGVLPKYVGIALILLEPGSMLTAMALSPIAPIADRGAYSGATEKGAVVALVACGRTPRSEAGERLTPFGLLGLEREVVGEHASDEAPEVDLGRPAELFTGFGGITDEQVDLGGRKNRGSCLTYFCQSSRPASSKAASTNSRTKGSGRGDDIVVGLVLLQHEPHRLHVVTGVAPVAARLERPQHEVFLQPGLMRARRW